jgi:2-dehydropantoate 2-reductase
MHSPKIVILGAGAVGSVIGAHLEKSGTHVLLINRHISHIRACMTGLHISGYQDFTVQCPLGTDDAAEIAAYPSIDTIVVATKAQATLVALSRLPADRDFRMVSAQNGLGTEKIITDHFPHAPVARMVITFGAVLEGDGHVHLTGNESLNSIGPVSRGSESFSDEMADAFTHAGLCTQYNADILSCVWEKTIINAAQNAPAALYNATLGELIDDHTKRELIEGIVNEAILVARKDGACISGDFFSSCLYDFEMYRNHKPSMLQDVLAGRSTEIDFINGAIVEKARKYGIPAPCNEKMVHDIKEMA